MFRNYFIVNLSLLIVTGLLSFRLYGVLADSFSIPTSVSLKPSQADNKDAGYIKREDQKDLKLDTATYQIISQKNLFHPTRSVLTPVKDTSEQPFPKETPKLFGTIIMNNKEIAILEDPASKITKLYSVNDLLAGYIISKIQMDKVILKRNGKSLKVRLWETKNIALPRKKTPSIQSQGSQRNLQSLPSKKDITSKDIKSFIKFTGAEYTEKEMRDMIIDPLAITHN